MRRMFAAGLVTLMLAGCGGPKLDGTSDESLKSSLDKVTADLPQDKKAQLLEDLKLITFSNIGEALSGQISAEQAKNNVRTTLNGKTAEDVAVIAANLRTERALKEKQQALAEIKQLQDIQQAAQIAKVEMAKFQILKSEFYFTEKNKNSAAPHGQPVVVAKVKNGTAFSIARVGFKGTVASAGRATPWFVGTVELPIPGGIEPGESPTWEITPNQFSEWGKLDAPAEALFSLEIIKLVGADGAVLFDASGLTPQQTERLQALQNKYAVN
ncbi:hypothetical protein LOY55_16900 [Pseudomonas sp. B21-040]|uniref:DUF6694 family lipoprotein n=1 Tax=Pseudomonas sp. B21-040 TaxID=2895486 RepID=UPI00216081EB|nr:DUF6694 family lipoprotein [Pseudomonas sp. B21-040]UVL37948.1 hypothetical protein LOY55_16900 [Pseudomonas sp. B21-040]